MTDPTQIIEQLDNDNQNQTSITVAAIKEMIRQTVHDAVLEALKTDRETTP